MDDSAGAAMTPDMQQTFKTEQYGWRKDKLDQRDWKLTVQATSLAQNSTVSTFSIRQEMPPIYNQLQLGSCTGNSTAGVLEHQANKQGRDHGTPSRLWIYYQGRVLEHTVGEDAGAEIRDVVKAVATIGCPPETDWEYDISTFRGPPPAAAQSVIEDNIYKGAQYFSCPQEIWHLKWCIANKFPVVFGFSVYEEFESEQVAATGIVPLPALNATLVGGHAVALIGWDDTKRMFEARNQYGEGWGDKGNFWMPYHYVLNPNLAADFWTIRLVV